MGPSGVLPDNGAVTAPLPPRFASDRLLAAIVETSDDAIVSKTLEGVILSWNAAAERMFGYTSAEATGRHISLIIPHERLPEEDAIMRRLRAGQRIDHFETERLHQDGRLIPVSLTISPLKDDRGKVIGASKIARDISERRRIEQAMKQAEASKDRFLATLSHELRNPLAPIRAAAQLIELKAAADPDLRHSSAMIDRQLAHMVRLLEDLLDVSRISRDKLELRKESLVLGTVIRAAAEASLPLITSARHQLDVLLPDQALHLHGDPVRLAQVFSNVLNNAAKYMAPGGRIDLRAARDGDQVHVSIKDRGVGIEPEALPKLFDMFWQALPDSHRTEGGLGIGLALARAIVELHGGSIEAHSAGAGQGSEFVVRLPLSEDPVAAAPEARREKAAAGKRSIVVVDDLRDSADSLATLLSALGHDVETAYNGTDAIQLASRRRPDVMLIDLGMPGLSGDAVARRIRLQPGGAGIFLIAVTGWGNESDRARTHAAGFDEHLVKPVDGVALSELIAQLPERRVI
jgi:PAS domain S-box-containing protein